MPDRGRVIDVEIDDCRIPPDDGWSIGHRNVETRTNRTLTRGLTLRPAIQHTILTKLRAARCGTGIPAREAGRKKHRIQDAQPTFYRLIACGGHNKKISRPRYRYVCESDSLGPISS